MSLLPSPLPPTAAVLPSDRRYQLGGLLFLVSLLVFFLSSITLYLFYAHWRRHDPQTGAELPAAFLISTLCLLVISGLVHLATRTVRRDRHHSTSGLLLASGIAATVFMAIQCEAMSQLLGGPALSGGTGKGVAGMVVVLALLHALHVAGGVIALGIVSLRSLRGRYDHERHWPVDICVGYWHFLGVVWLAMLLTFYLSRGVG